MLSRENALVVIVRFRHGGRKLVKFCVDIRVGYAFVKHRSEHLHLEVRDQPGDLFDGLAAPAVRSDNRGVLELGPQQVGEVRRIVDRRMRSDMLLVSVPGVVRHTAIGVPAVTSRRIVQV